MKKILFIISCLAALSACSKNGVNGREPEVSNPPHNIIKASIADYGTERHIWSEGDLFGLYGSRSGENVRYVVEKVSFEKNGEARIYGRGVDGDVYGYFPFREEGYSSVAEGRQPLPSEQRLCASAREQIMANTVMVAKLENEALSFSWLCGILHVHLTAEISGSVRSASLLSDGLPVSGNYSIIGKEPLMENPGYEVTLSGIDKPCGEAAPLDLFFMLPPGNYPALSIRMLSSAETVIKPIDIAVEISSKAEVNCTVTDKETIYDGTDIIIINGEFDD